VKSRCGVITIGGLLCGQAVLGSSIIVKDEAGSVFFVTPLHMRPEAQDKLDLGVGIVVGVG